MYSCIIQRPCSALHQIYIRSNHTFSYLSTFHDHNSNTLSGDGKVHVGAGVQHIGLLTQQFAYFTPFHLLSSRFQAGCLTHTADRFSVYIRNKYASLRTSSTVQKHKKSSSLQLVLVVKPHTWQLWFWFQNQVISLTASLPYNRHTEKATCWLIRVEQRNLIT